MSNVNYVITVINSENIFFNVIICNNEAMANKTKKVLEHAFERLNKAILEDDEVEINDVNDFIREIWEDYDPEDFGELISSVGIEPLRVIYGS